MMIGFFDRDCRLRRLRPGLATAVQLNQAGSNQSNCARDPESMLRARGNHA
jgi:hypothetical protein